MRTGKINLKWWQLALLSVAVSILGKIAEGKSSDDEETIYKEEFNQAPWAPPAWLFGPAWTVNNFFLLWALQDLINSEDNKYKKSLLLLQLPIWAIFFTFNYIYVNKKSTILAAIWTKADSLLAIISFILAMIKDKKFSWNYAPLAAWTTFASTVADYQALKNPDPFMKTKALFQ
jgi:tryptophan-rich sensory protein